MTTIVSLREIAHSRSGEKGNSSMISVIAYDMADYEMLREQVSVEAVRKLFGPVARGDIQRYEAPRIGALNFVLNEVLEGGRSRTLAFEESGKALSSLMLTLPISLPAGRQPRTKPHGTGEPMAASSSVPPAKGQKAKAVRLGAATAWSRDRFEPALELVEKGKLDYLCFESMSEVTMSAAQAARLDAGATVGYDPYLTARLSPILAQCKEKGIKIISNQGWLDPEGAARKVRELAAELGIDQIKIAAVNGGVLTGQIADLGLVYIEDGEPISDSRDRIVSAEAYLGCEGIVQALRDGADVVITTRVADACLYLGPLAFEFDWSLDDYGKMARGMVIGHLMECGAQVCGGYFADPGYKEVPDLDRVGHPIAEITEDSIVLTKTPGSGGLLTPATCKEQLLYEVANPAQYLAPDCVANLTAVSFKQIAENTVEVGLHDDVGAPRPPTLKALVGIREGYMTEEMVIFAGPAALERARMTQDILEKRFKTVALDAQEVRYDYLGMNAVHREATPVIPAAPYEVILRVAIKTRNRDEAEKLRREIDPLAVNGVSGTGKWATSVNGSRVRTVIGLNSCLVPRDLASVTVSFF